MSHIFISYSRKDLAIAERIIDALAKDDLEPWIDWKSIPKGETIEEEIQQGIEKAEIFLFLVSPDSIQSDWCNKEIAHAVKNGKRILPIVIRDADLKNIHPEISKRNWIFCRDGQDDFKKAIEETRKTIHTDYEWLKYHTELQVKALKWKQKNDNSRLLRGKELQEAEKQLSEVSIHKDPHSTDLQRHYVYISRRNEERLRRRNMIGLIIGLATVIVLSIVAWGQRNIAIDEKKKTEEKNLILFSRQLASQSRLIDDELWQHRILSNLLAIESLHRYPSLDGDQALRRSLELMPRLISTIVFEDSNIDTAALSPGGNLLITGQFNGPTLVWDINSGEKIAQIPNNPLSVMFSPSGELVGIGLSDGGVSILETVNWNEIAHLSHGDSVNSLAFGSDGRRVVSGSADGSIKIWDISTGKEIADMEDGNSVLSISLSSDGNKVASGDSEGKITIWDARSGMEIIRMFFDDNSEFGSHSVNSLSFSPDSKTIISGANDGTARIWEVQTGKEIARIKYSNDYDNSIQSVTFNFDGNLLATGGYDGTARILDVVTQQEIARVSHKDERRIDVDPYALVYPVEAVLFFPNKNKFITVGNDAARIWELTREQENTLIKNANTPRDILINTTTNQLLIFSNSYSADDEDTIVQIINYEIGTQHIQTMPDYRYTSLALSQSNYLTALGTWGGVIEVWQTTPWSEIAEFSHADDVFSIAFSQDGKFLISGSDDRTAKAWDLTTQKELGVMNHEDQVVSVALSRDNKLAASGSSDGKIIIWNPLSGEKLTSFQHRYAESLSLSFSPDNKFFVSADSYEINVWDTVLWEKIAHFAGEGMLPSLTFSLDGRWAAMTACSYFSSDIYITNNGCWKSVVLIWDTLNWKETLRVEFGDFVSGISFTSDGKYVAMGGYNGSIRIWDVENRIEIARILTNDPVLSVAFSPNDQYIISIDYSENGLSTIKYNLWKTNDTIANACDRVTRNFTSAEWLQYFPDENYRATCPQWPTDPSIYLLIAANALSNDDDPANLQIVLDKVKSEMQKDIAIKDPDNDSLRIVKRAVTDKIHDEVQVNNWDKIVRLLKQASILLADRDDAFLLDTVCHRGSLEGYAKDVLEYCDQAVQLFPDNENFRDSRGIARVLAGDYEGAVLDFQYVVENSLNDEVILTRKQWITELEKGNNPFTFEVLESLK